MIPRYTSYAPSDAVWVGDIPAHWSVAPLGSVLIESKAKNTGMSETNLLSLSFGRIVPKNIDSNEGLLPASFESYQVVEPDFLIFRFTDLQNDQHSLRSARVTERGIITSAYAAARPVGIVAKYAEYLMRSYDTSKVLYGLGGGVRQSLKFADVSRLPVLIPTEAEQEQIARYLDRETARIDSLINEQRRLIEMLLERRQAAIDHAFEGAEKSSRVARACIDIVDCPHTTPQVDEDGQFEAVRTASVRGGVFRAGRALRVSEETWRQRNAGGFPSIGDILFAREGGSAGEAAMVPSTDICLGQRMVLLRIDPRMCVGEFLMWQILSSQIQNQFRLALSGAAAPNIRLSVLRGTPIWLPSVEAQRSVLGHLRKQTASIDTLVAESERLIALARERRSALITAAVTGQIDVRERVA